MSKFVKAMPKIPYIDSFSGHGIYVDGVLMMVMMFLLPMLLMLMLILMVA